MKKTRNFIVGVIILVGVIGLSLILIKLRRSNDSVIETYSLNQQGWLKPSGKIIDEKFDEKNNLTYYKYLKSDDEEALEFYYKYQYDEQNRIKQIDLNEQDNAKIDYSDDGKIMKIEELVMDQLGTSKDRIVFSFEYINGSEINVKKDITYNLGNEGELTKSFKIYYKSINKDGIDCIELIEKNSENKVVNEALYVKGNTEMDYNSMYSITNIVPLGYMANDSYLRISANGMNSLLIEYPVLFNGNVICINSFSEMGEDSSVRYNYDKLGRALVSKLKSGKYEQEIKYKYNNLENKKYEESIIKKIFNGVSTKYSAERYFVYTDENSNVEKKELIQKNDISEDEYRSVVNDYETYNSNEVFEL